MGKHTLFLIIPDLGEQAVHLPKHVLVSEHKKLTLFRSTNLTVLKNIVWHTMMDCHADQDGRYIKHRFQKAGLVSTRTGQISVLEGSNKCILSTNTHDISSCCCQQHSQEETNEPTPPLQSRM